MKHNLPGRRAEPLDQRLRARHAGEIQLRLLGQQVHIAKRHDALMGLLQNLRAPARLLARVVALTALEAQLFQRTHQIHEVTP